MGYSYYFNGTLHLDRQIDDDTLQALTELFDEDGCRFLRDNGKELPEFDCPWILSETGDALEIAFGDSGARAYGFLEWLTYLFHEIFEPRGYKFTNEDSINYDGDESDDFGIIDVIDGKPVIKYGERTYKEPQFI